MGWTAFDVLWLLTALPGLAVLRRVDAGWLERGGFAALSSGYLATFALLSPLAIAGYALAWPVRVLTLVLLVAIPLAAIDLLRDWRTLRAQLRPGLLGAIVLAMVVADYLAARQVGTHWPGDAAYHLGKVRTLMDHGLVHWDPYSPQHRFDPVYHSNLYHALIAAWAEYAGLRPFDAWVRMLPWSKLLIAGSAQALAHALSRSRPLALAAAGAAVLAWLPMTILPYPSQLAGLWLLPLALASAVELVAGERPRLAALGLAAVALVLAQLHALYYAFQCLVLGPMLLAALAWALARRSTRAHARVAALGLLALGVGLPWLATSALARRAEERAAVPAAAPVAAAPAPDPSAELLLDDEAADGPDGEPADDPRATNWRYRGFRLLPGDRVMFEPSALSPGNQRVQLVLALLLLVAFARARRPVLALAAIAAKTLLVLHVPALCTWAVRAAGAPWIVRRLDVVVVVLALAVVPCALGILLHERGWLRGPLPHALFALAIGYAYLTGADGSTWSRSGYFAKVRDPARVRREVDARARRAELLQSRVPAGALVVASPGRALELPHLCDCYPFALPSGAGAHGVPDMAERRSAMYQLLSHRTDRPTRLSLLKHYDVRYLLADKRRGGNALAQKLTKIQRLTLDVSRSRHDILISVDPGRRKRGH